MAEEFSKDTGTDFRHIQDSISDPKSNKYALATYSAVVLTIFLSGYLTEWVFSAFVAINLVIIYSLLPIFKFPKPGSKYFVKKVYNGLVNRKEGYEKIGDENRSEACNFYVMQILDKYKDLLEIEKPVVDLEDVYSYWASIYSGEQLLEGGESFDDERNYVYNVKKLKYSLEEIKDSLIAKAIKFPEAREVAKIAYGDLMYFRDDVEDKIKTGGPDLEALTEMINSEEDGSEIARRYLDESGKGDYQFNPADEIEKLFKEFDANEQNN